MSRPTSVRSAADALQLWIRKRFVGVKVWGLQGEGVGSVRQESVRLGFGVLPTNIRVDCGGVGWDMAAGHTEHSPNLCALVFAHVRSRQFVCSCAGISQPPALPKRRK